MQRQRSVIVGAVIAIVVASGTLLGVQRPQLPLAPVNDSGDTVTAVFEGWYENPDGTFSLSFGYFNRNAEEVLEIPIGPNNFIEPGDANQGQPTLFQPRRHWGVFAVKVPADFGDKEKVWTLSFRGETVPIPGNLRPDWKIDALEGEAGGGNTPPVLKFDLGGPAGAGPGGISVGPLRATVGTPLTVTVWATDDGVRRASVREEGAPPTVTLAWFKHQGPGEVTFSEPTPEVDEATNEATTTATFSAPGDYILRVRANDASGVTRGGHAQCCWTNGFVKVTVTGNNE